MLARGEPIGYRKTVATTWALAFSSCSNPRRARLGCCGCWPSARPKRSRCACCCNPALGSPSELGAEVAPVLVPLLEDQLAAKDAIAALRRYSLITPAADGSVSVHRLVQAVTADQMPADLAERVAAGRCRPDRGRAPRRPRPPGTWPVFAALLPHAQAALDADSDGMGGSPLPGIQRELRGRPGTPEDRLTHRMRVLGPEHPDTLPARGNLARWTGEAGDAAGARDQFAALLPVRERVLGPEHS